MASTPKRLPIYFSDEALTLLAILQDGHGENDLSLSGAVNLSAQLVGLVARIPLPITTNQLLYACDILNGGASLTEFSAPDAGSIRRALEGMKHSLIEGFRYEREVAEKWGVDALVLAEILDGLDDAQLFTLGFATRQFWSGKPFGDIKPLSECDGYQEWASQWISEGAHAAP